MIPTTTTDLETSEPAIGQVTGKSRVNEGGPDLSLYLKKIFTFGVIIVVGLIGYGVYYWYTSSQAASAEVALTELSRIRPYFDQGSYELALTAEGVPQVGDQNVMGLQSIVDTYGNTAPGQIAALLAGNCYLQTDKPDQAQEMFSIAIKHSAPEIQLGAYRGMAACAEQKGNWAEAGDLFARAAEVGIKTGLEDACLLASGLCYEKANDKEKASSVLLDLVKRFENTESSNAARAVLSRLGMAFD